MSGSNCSVSPVANDADQVGSLISMFLKKKLKVFLTAEAVLVIAFTLPPPLPPLQFRKKLY